MWPVVHDLSISGRQADALFASGLQRCDEPSVGQVRQAVVTAIRSSATRTVPPGWRRNLAIIPRRQ